MQLSKSKIVRASFIGGAIGDAAGLATEGIGRHQAAAQYRKSMVPNISFGGWLFQDFDPATLYSDLNGHPKGVIEATLKIERSDPALKNQFGVYTDDTSQLFAVVESIIDHRGKIHRRDIARRLRQWSSENGIGMGRNFFNAVSHADFLTNPHAAAFDFLESMSFVPAANGAVMRSAPLGALSLASTSREDFHFQVADIAAITHANPRCILASVFVACLVAGILQEKTECALLEYALEKAFDVYSRSYEPDAPWTIGIENYRGRCAPRHWDDAHAELRQLVENIWSDASLTNLSPIQPDCDMDNIGNAPIGYTYLPIRLLVASLKLQLPFDVAILQIISLGGDADTNACIVGSVLAAQQPENPKLTPWIQKLLPVQKMRVIDMAQRFAAAVSGGIFSSDGDSHTG